MLKRWTKYFGAPRKRWNVRIQFKPYTENELSSAPLVAHVKRWLHDGKGLMASKSVPVVIAPLQFADTSWNSGGDCGIKMRPTKEELSSMSPEFDHRWSTYFANAPDKPVILVVPVAL